MKITKYISIFIVSILLSNCLGKKDYKLEEVLSVEQQQDLRWIKADTCECFILNSFAENPLDSVYVSWSGKDTNGLANGSGRLIIKDKAGARLKYEGTVESGFIKGSGVLTKPDKSVYTGSVYFVEYGKGERVLENGDQETGIFQDGNLHTGTVNKIDTVIHRWRNSEITKTEYDRRQKQVEEYFTEPIIGQTTRYYLDSLWIPCKKEDASYYRIVNMSHDNYPKDGVITDFYINGNKQNEFDVLHVDLKYNIHTPSSYNKYYLESGELRWIIYYLNWKRIKTEVFNSENKLVQQMTTQPNYYSLYKFYDENGVITETQLHDREDKHSYARLSNGDTVYKVYDSLGYDQVSYREEKTTDNFIKKGWYSYVKNDEHSYPISTIKYYTKTGKLYKSQNWVNLRDSAVQYDFLHEYGNVSYLGNDMIEVDNTNDSPVYYLFDFDYPDNLDWNVKINFKMDSRIDGLFLVYNWEDWDNHNIIAIFNNDGGYLFKSQLFEGKNYDTKPYDSYRRSTDWQHVDFTKKDDKITVNGLTRNEIPIDEDILESMGLVFLSKTKYNIGHIIQSIYSDTTISNVETIDIAPNENVPSKVLPWQSYGSGVVLSSDGYVITNYHVIEEATDVEIGLVKDNKIRYYTGEIISKDQNNDLALLRINDEEFKRFKDIPFNLNTEQVSVGKEVFALGYPLKALLGEELKFTNGRISARSGVQGDISKYQMTVPLQPGNSGGPVFDFNGNLIGIAQGGIKYDVAENVAYCVKSTYVNSLIESLPQKFDLPDDTSNKGDDLEDIIKTVSPYVTLVRVR